MQSPKGWLKVIISCVVVISVVVFLFLLFYGYPKKIDIEYEAMEYRVGKPESGEAIKIKVKGIMKKPLFRDPTFHGQFIIDKYDYTENYQLSVIELYHDVLYYYQNVNGFPSLKTLGYLLVSNNFYKLNIVVNEENKDGPLMKDLRISAPANNYEEAMKINNELYGY